MASSGDIPAGPVVRQRSPFWSLLWLTIDNTFGFSAARYTYLRRKQRLWEPALIFFGLGTAGVMLLFLFYELARAFVLSGAALGQPQISFVFAVLVTSVIILFFGLMAVISVFFFSNDLEVLVPLPLSPGHIVLTKFASVLLGEYIGVVLVMGPTAYAYAQVMGGGLGYWVSVVLVSLLLPVIPLAVASLLSLLGMRVINRKHRDILLVAFGVVFGGALLFLQMTFLNNVPETDPAAYLRQILSGQISLVNLIGRGYPPSIWAANAIASSDLALRLGSALGYLAVSAVAVAVMGVVGGRVFYGGLIGGEEVARRRLTARQSAAARAAVLAGMSQGGVVRALFWREWRLFMRVPIYVMNGFLASIIVPVIFIAGGKGVLRDPDMKIVLQAVNGSGNAAFFTTLGLAALIVFLVGLNTTTSTAVSREGKYFWISKVIPATPAEQVRAKLLFGLAGALISTAPIILIFPFFLRMTPFHILVAGGLGLLGSLALLAAGLLFDMSRPLLKWTNPQQAVKSNLNVIVPLPIAAALVAAMVFVIRWLYYGLGLGEAGTALVVAVLLAALAVPAYLATVGAAKRLYERLEP